MAESCTGGLIAASITNVSGASVVFHASLVTYSNTAKMRLLGVPEEHLLAHGAVSGEVAEAMTQGVLLHTDVDIALSVTGIAGPGGGSEEKPVGTVWFGCQLSGDLPVSICKHFEGDRASVREQSVEFALVMLHGMVEGFEGSK